DRLKFLASVGAVRPWLQGDEKECVVARLNVAEQAEPNDAGRVLNARRLGENILDIACGLFRALQRGGIRKLKIYKDISLILVGQEAGRQFRAKKAGSHAEKHQGGDG